jgi:hypothetical protein
MTTSTELANGRGQRFARSTRRPRASDAPELGASPDTVSESGFAWTSPVAWALSTRSRARRP